MLVEQNANLGIGKVRNTEALQMNLLRILTALLIGSFTTPSFVSFTDKERLIGESAKNQAAMNPRNTIFDIKSVLPSKPSYQCANASH